MRLWRTPSPEALEGMLPNPTACLARLNADKLKKLARLWVGKDAYKMNKEASLRAVTHGRGDAGAIRAVLASLSDFERAGLWLIKARGWRTAYTEELAGELMMLGFPYKGQVDGRRYFYSFEDSAHAAVNALLDTALIMRADGSGQHHSRYSPSLAVFADAKVLAAVEPVAPKPLAIEPVPARAPGWLRRPGEVLLQLLAMRRALSEVPEIPLTARGLRAKPAISRLGKLLGWTGAGAAAAPAPFPNELDFYLSLFEAAGLLREMPGERLLRLDGLKADAALAVPFTAQARRWARAYRALLSWSEAMPDAIRFYHEPEPTDPSAFNTLRGALLLSLGALPEPASWYRIDDLSDAIYARIGRHFTLGFRHHFQAPHGTPPGRLAALRSAWEAEQQETWRKLEGIWIASALTGALYQLGLVELAASASKGKKAPDLFRLTEAGQAAVALRPGAASERAAEAQTAWVVQPNFDCILYLEDAAPGQLAFIDRIAERRQLGGDTALYRLTREATYRALESGLSAETLIRTLRQGSRHPLPEAVARSLADWAARRERLSVHLGARLLEFASPAARDAALDAGAVKGTALGERYVLVRSLSRDLCPGAIIAYEPALSRCLNVSEEGEIRIDPAGRDLLIASELAALSEPIPGDEYRWCITRASVARAVARGWSATEVLNRLARRACHRLPPILEHAVRAWGGGRNAPVALPTVPILQVSDREVAEAIAQSALLGPYLAGRLGPQSFLVTPGEARALAARLADLGFAVGNEVVSGGSPARAGG